MVLHQYDEIDYCEQIIEKYYRMKLFALAFVSTLAITLGACSDSDEPAGIQDDDTNTLDANNFRGALENAVTQLRGTHFDAFINAPEEANQLFAVPLPDATDYFGPTAFPVGSETIDCDSGSVTRDVTSSDADRLTIQANFIFVDCNLQGKRYNGQTTVLLNGDAPSRLGGQTGVVTMQFDDMSVKSGTSQEITRSLNGSFENRSGWSAASIRYTHEYITDRYTEVNVGNDFSISDAYYKQELQSDYYPDDDRYYRLSEVGSLTLDRAAEQLQPGYTISIDPVLLYSSKLNSQNSPVYDDDIASGKVSYIATSSGSVNVTPAETDSSLVVYEVFDGAQSFSETDEWAFPIACMDNSAMNNRDLCDIRQ